MLDEDITTKAEVKRQALMSWVLEKVKMWEEYRDNNFRDKWNEYYRLWRGIWHETDKTRNSERSKLIVPAISQAVDMAVAEQEEAVFGQGAWFDIQDDFSDPNQMDVQLIRKSLNDDLELVYAPAAISESLLNGALYGNGALKIRVERVTDRVPATRPMGDGQMQGGIELKEVIRVFIEPISMRDFVIDPVAKTVDDGLGCAHIFETSRSSIIKKQNKGIYYDCDIGSYEDDSDVSALGESKDRTTSDKARVIEYYGLVPAGLLPMEGDEDTEYEEDEENGLDYDEDDLVEALITIVNESELLKGVKNPYMMEDRPVVGYAYDTVPNRWYGRGVVEKGYNPQKALDAELRARIDALALSAHPMMAVDGSAMPRGIKPTVSPGNTIITNGKPHDVLMPFNFGGINQYTFSEAGELERMIQMGTGVMDSATPVGVSPRNQTASGMSMIRSGALLRSRRALQNIERHLLVPLLRKVAFRYMQFDPERYPVRDFKFFPKTTLALTAREYEQQQQLQLLSLVPPDSAAHGIILKAIYNNSSLSNKDELVQAIDEMLQPKPPTPEQQEMAMLQKELLKADISSKNAKMAEVQATTQLERERLNVERDRFQADVDLRREIERDKISVQRVVTEAEVMKKEADAILALAKADSEEAAKSVESYKSQLEAIKSDNIKIINDMSSLGQEAARENIEKELIVRSGMDALYKQQAELAQTIQGMMQDRQALEQTVQQLAQGTQQIQQTDTNMGNEIQQLMQAVQDISNQLNTHIQDYNKPKKIKRDSSGRIVSINGKEPIRNEQGLIEEI